LKIVKIYLTEKKHPQEIPLKCYVSSMFSVTQHETCFAGARSFRPGRFSTSVSLFKYFNLQASGRKKSVYFVFNL